MFNMFNDPAQETTKPLSISTFNFQMGMDYLPTPAALAHLTKR
jgi:hypothetical protein